MALIWSLGKKHKKGVREIYWYGTTRQRSKLFWIFYVYMNMLKKDNVVDIEYCFSKSLLIGHVLNSKSLLCGHALNSTLL